MPSPLKALDVADLRLLEAPGEALAIENWEEDGPLLAWREALTEAGIRSLLAFRMGTEGRRNREQGIRNS